MQDDRQTQRRPPPLPRRHQATDEVSAARSELGPLGSLPAATGELLDIAKALLRRYLTDEDTPVRIRAIACLMLLYAQPLSRIFRLTTCDITHDDGQTWICFGHPPAPVPEPFASLLHQQISAQPASHCDWLFPGRNPGQPAAYGTIFTLLRDRGFPMRTARVSALRQRANAAGTWAHYPGRDHVKYRPTHNGSRVRITRIREPASPRSLAQRIPAFHLM
jgi:integrase